ncbi:MAG TPA: hypothetical protein VGO62_19170 [Myxococcota bacterium]|jgi:hypothetical protein
MRKTYRLQSWRGWDRRIDACAREFLAEFGVAPNLLVANGVTLRRINVAADKARLGNAKGEPAPASEYVELRGFAAEDYELVFLEEDEVPENSFALIHAFGAAPSPSLRRDGAQR